jgi:hypothetical protein
MIKNYLDLIEWIRSPKNTNKDYSLTLFQSCILQRLIKYSRVNENITYSNEVISEHMFRSKKHVENNLPFLTKKNLILTKVNRSKDDQGYFISKRTIRINWNKLQEIKTEMEEYLSKMIKEENIQQEEGIHQGYQCGHSNEIKKVDSCPTDNDDTIGYRYIKKSGESYTIENNNSVYMRYMGVGDQLSLYFLNQNGQKEIFITTYKKKLKKYFDTNGVEFKDLTKQDLMNMN